MVGRVASERFRFVHQCRHRCQLVSLNRRQHSLLAPVCTHAPSPRNPSAPLARLRERASSAREERCKRNVAWAFLHMCCAHVRWCMGQAVVTGESALSSAAAHHSASSLVGEPRRLTCEAGGGNVVHAPGHDAPTLVLVVRLHAPPPARSAPGPARIKQTSSPSDEAVQGGRAREIPDGRARGPCGPRPGAPARRGYHPPTRTSPARCCAPRSASTTARSASTWKNPNAIAVRPVLCGSIFISCPARV